jgi:two-component system, OmpR family, sensor kinase
LRLALAFGGVMAIVLTATGLFLYLHLRSDLDHALDQGLRSRAGDVSALVREADTGLRDAAATRAGGPGAAVAQILQASGRVFDASPGVSRRSLLTAAELRAARRSTVSVARATTPASPAPMRLLATPVDAQDRHLVVVVGASLADRDQALARLGTLLLIGGGGALLLASLAGYGLASAALRPVESMRRRAASISTDRLHERLPLGRSRDELHRLGETLNDMLSRLEAGMERQRAFTADASHELRTPLTMLKTELELIARDQPTGADLTGSARAAVDEADRLARLIDDLLVLARTDGDEVPLRLEKVDVTELLTAVKARYEQPDRHQRITLTVPDEPVVRADPARLQQALGNMLDNALRHGESPVSLEAAARDGFVELHVRDAGPGIPPWFLPGAFDRFTRADHGRGQGGTGLGLAIVQAIARSHGGEAHIANGSDRGTDVWIAIPASRPGDTHEIDTPRSGTVQDRAGMLSARMSQLTSRRRLPRALIALPARVVCMLLR